MAIPCRTSRRAGARSGRRDRGSPPTSCCTSRAGSNSRRRPRSPGDSRVRRWGMNRRRRRAPRCPGRCCRDGGERCCRWPARARPPRPPRNPPWRAGRRGAASRPRCPGRQWPRESGARIQRRSVAVSDSAPRAPRGCRSAPSRWRRAHAPVPPPPAVPRRGAGAPTPATAPPTLRPARRRPR